MDSDYEIDDSDDDLLVDNVDLDVNNESASKGLKMYKWNKAKGCRLQRQHGDSEPP